MHNIILFLVIALGLPGQICEAAQESLGNISPGTTIVTPQYVPGSWVVLPDGRRTIIREYLPNGQLRTDLGVVISPEGTIVEGADKGKKAEIMEQAQIQPGEHAKVPEFPGQAVITPEQKPVEPAVTAPGQKPDEQSREPEIVVAVPGREPVTPAQQKPEESAGKQVQPAPAGPLTIVELLPTTKVPEEKARQAKPEPEKKEPVKKEPEKKKAEKRKQAAENKNPEKPKEAPYKKPAVGQELRIPPDAAKTGNLDFLEGCWQGTRPEYYSKRTIRECFCFGKNGKNGKRRIFDSQFHRMCIGGANANLSKSGLLSVTSSGGACNDGERWGSARMQCQNSGPRTPCSWIFPDAQGGHQSYTIPFVRVESCGR